MKKEVLEVSQFSCGYFKKEIIKDVSFKVYESELVGIIGLNGSGKSTLIKGLCMVLKSSGKVSCCNKNLFEMSAKKRARYIGYISQRPTISSPLSVLEVVLMGLNPYLNLLQYPSKAQKQHAKEILESLGLKNVIFKNFLELSEGQRQLVLLARIILQNSKLMLLDEPDSALDFNNRHSMLSMIKNLVKLQNKAALYCMHDVNFALGYCDRIILIKEGRIVSDFKCLSISLEDLKKELSKIYGGIDVVCVNGKRMMLKGN